MCGRVALFSPPSRLARFVEASLAAGLSPEGHPSWNVGPQRTLFAVTERPEGRVLDAYRWGLLPAWAKDPAVSNKLINARGETVAEKPSFKAAFRSRPCVIPVDGFYEWIIMGTQRFPHYFTRVDGDPCLFAGIYEYWRDPRLPSDAAPIQTVTVLTTEPSTDVNTVHDRMPVILTPEDVEGWIDPSEEGPGRRLALIRSAPAGTLSHYACNKAVGSVKNDGPSMLDHAETPTMF